MLHTRRTDEMPPKASTTPYRNWCFVLNERKAEMRSANNQLYQCPLVKVSFADLVKARAEGREIDGDVMDVNSQFHIPMNLLVCLVCQLEVAPTTGTIHLQGMLQLRRAANFLDLKGGLLRSVVGEGDEINWSFMRKPKKASVLYCSKEDTRLKKTSALKLGQVDDEGIESEVFNHSVSEAATTLRGDRKRAREEEKKKHMVEESRLLMEIWRYGVETNKEFSELAIHVREQAMQWAIGGVPEMETMTEEDRAAKQKAYGRVLQKFLSNSRPLQLEYQGFIMGRERKKCLSGVMAIRDVVVRVYLGPPGTGKTYAATVRYAGHGVYVKDMQQRWWNGYIPAVHKVIVLDDFHGHNPQKQGAIFTPEYCQRLLDGQALKLDRKFESHADAAYGMVIITTNLEFDDWFGNWFMVPSTIKESIRSRIGQGGFIRFSGTDLRTHYKKVMPERKDAVVKRVSVFTGEMNDHPVHEIQNTEHVVGGSEDSSYHHQNLQVQPMRMEQTTGGEHNDSDRNPFALFD